LGYSGERAAPHQALATLTPEHRAVVGLHYLEGLTVDQIAERVGARPGTVKSRLHYGVAELRAAYEAAEREPGGTDR
jgi:RNA polymerase sigma-70 factor (ECF subfamily)